MKVLLLTTILFILTVWQEVCFLPVCAYRYVCLGGSSTPTPSDGLHGYLCPVGHHCPVGSAREVPCDPGSYSPAPGAAHCVICPKGTMCPSFATREPSICSAGEDGENKLRPTVERSHLLSSLFNSNIVPPKLNKPFFPRSLVSCWDRPASAVSYGNFQQPDRSTLSLCLHTLSCWCVLWLAWRHDTNRWADSEIISDII